MKSKHSIIQKFIHVMKSMNSSMGGKLWAIYEKSTNWYRSTGETEIHTNRSTVCEIKAQYVRNFGSYVWKFHKFIQIKAMLYLSFCTLNLQMQEIFLDRYFQNSENIMSSFWLKGRIYKMGARYISSHIKPGTFVGCSLIKL